MKRSCPGFASLITRAAIPVTATVTNRRICTILLVAVLAVVAAAARPEGAIADDQVRESASDLRVSEPSGEDLPLLTKLRIDGRRITVEIACREDERVDILLGYERVRLGSADLLCRYGSARGVVSSRSNRVVGLGARETVLVELAGQDRRVLASLPLDRTAGSRQRALQANLTWVGPASICSRSYGASRANIELIPNGARFGYAFGTGLWWRGMILEYNPRTGAQTWHAPNPWSHHVAGMSSTESRQSFTLNPGSFYRPAIQIYGGDWNYVAVTVQLGTGLAAHSGWCYVG